MLSKRKQRFSIVSQGFKIGEFDTREEAEAYCRIANEGWLEYKQQCLDEGEPYADNQCFVCEEEDE